MYPIYVGLDEQTWSQMVTTKHRQQSGCPRDTRNLFLTRGNIITIPYDCPHATAYRLFRRANCEVKGFSIKWPVPVTLAYV